MIELEGSAAEFSRTLMRGQAMAKTYVIAEAGVNHNGSPERAVQMVDAAAQAGADAVKFQTFKAEHGVSRYAVKAAYQVRTTGEEESQLEMVRKLELDVRAHYRIAAHCRERGIEFLSTPFDWGSVDLLVHEMKLPRVKIGSGEVTNAPLLLRLARTGTPLILSTGMSLLGDVETALGVLAFGFTGGAEKPSVHSFARAYLSQEGQEALRQKVVLMHCTTEYPTPSSEVNLRAMQTLGQAFGLPVGLSDHTVGYAVAIAGVALGACVIEKHFTLDRNLPGPDHQSSLEPAELKAMVTAIREVETALGSAQKLITSSERGNIQVARKSLIALTAIAQGDVFKGENLGVKRPGTGISPLLYWDFLGRKAERDYRADELIEE